MAVLHSVHEHDLPYARRERVNRWGLWLFLISESFMFAGLLGARFYLWGGARPPLNQSLGLLLTSILLVSSFFMNRAEVAIAHDDRPEFLRSAMLTVVLGMAFLVGVVGWEWGLFLPDGPHLRPTDGAFGAVVYGLTGFHAFHVLTGVLAILAVWHLGRRGHFSARQHWGVEAVAVYWHFVDLVWVFFYPALYLIGQVVAAGH